MPHHRRRDERAGVGERQDTQRVSRLALYIVARTPSTEARHHPAAGSIVSTKDVCHSAHPLLQ